MTTVAEIAVVGDADRWRALGFAVDGDVMQLGGIRVRFVAATNDSGVTPVGICSWTLADAPDTAVALIDGLPTLHGTPSDPINGAAHPNGVLGIDHLVVYTPDLDRTCAAIEAATAAPLKRVREVGVLRQGFHRLGELIVEVVTFPDVAVQQATFWGLALNVSNIDSLFASTGSDVLSPPKDAVQPGRRIASFREAAGLGLPVAVMSSSAR
jgi:hypothetical protein